MIAHAWQKDQLRMHIDDAMAGEKVPTITPHIAYRR